MTTEEVLEAQARLIEFLHERWCQTRIERDQLLHLQFVREWMAKPEPVVTPRPQPAATAVPLLRPQRSGSHGVRILELLMSRPMTLQELAAAVQRPSTQVSYVIYHLRKKGHLIEKFMDSSEWKYRVTDLSQQIETL